MSNNRFISGMVMYTIKDDDLRKKVHDGIIDEFGDNELNESTYEIKCASESTSRTVSVLEKICTYAKKETGKEFIKNDPENKNDFVTFYRATNSLSPKPYRIEQIVIV